MVEVVLGLLFVFSFIGFAFYGFISFLIYLFGGKQEPKATVSATASKPKPDRSLDNDILGASHLLNHLIRTKRIDAKTYKKLRGFLDEEFSEDYRLCRKITTASELAIDATKDKEVEADVPVDVEDSISKVFIGDQGEIVDQDVEVVAPNAGSAAADTDTADLQSPAPVYVSPHDAIPHSIEDKEAALAASQSVQPLSEAQTQDRDAAGNLLPPAPWDLPDPPAPEPRRTFSEVMSGFMLEKNIRWGELASGILIVGSAVGLVVSLRNELRDTIPYFSALMFMLITAAIHGAGIYTLKKWKLRNTSRGTLLIGLLLIPLNFLAACILSGNETDRREITDPLLWTAIGVGLVSFGSMTWFSGKCLFKKGQLPMLLMVLGSAIGTLVINRTDRIDLSSLPKLWLSLPLAISFLIGTAFFYKRQWFRQRWPRRTAFRLFIFLGVSVFAFLVSASLLVIRADDKPSAVVALMPAVSIVALMVSWLGRIVWKGAGGTETQAIGLTGLTLHLLGGLLIVGSILTSFSNPTVLLVNAGIVSVGLLLFAKHQQDPRILPAAWLGFASFVFCTVNLTLSRLNWDSWASMNELGNAALSGESGLSLLLAGAAVVVAHVFYGRWSKDQSRFLRIGAASGAIIFAVGCGLALLASFAHPENLFDNMTATALLGLAALLAMSGCVFQAKRMADSRILPEQSLTSSTSTTGEDGHAENDPSVVHSLRNKAIAELAPWGASGILLGFLLHAFEWNPVLSEWLHQTAFSIGANWFLVFTMHAAIVAGFALAAYLVIRKRFSTSSDGVQSGLAREIVWQFGSSAAVTSMIGVAGSFYLLSYQTGLATGVVAFTALTWFLLTISQQFSSERLSNWSAGFSLLTGLSVSFFILEFLTKLSWCPGWREPQHWLIQIVGLSIWMMLWFVVTWFVGQRKQLHKFVDFHPALDLSLVVGLTIGAVGLIGVALFGESRVELFVNAAQPRVDLSQSVSWGFAALASVGGVLLIAMFRKPRAVLGAASILIWCSLFSFGAIVLADAKAVATGIRWLLPIGGALGAVLVACRKPLRPVWAKARNSFGLPGRSTWSASSTQVLINFALAVVAVVVLSVSTVAIVQVIMNGGVSALGGPLKATFFGDMKKDVSYGIPVGVIVGTFLLYAISERRKWLATAGSAVFQYCVVLSVVLLFVSPHPKLASSWFVNILQAVSIGMTGYGFVWWYFQSRIESGSQSNRQVGSPSQGRLAVSQLQTHTVINGLLITSLAVLVMVRFFRFPDLPGDWINSVGGPLGVLAWAIFGGLTYAVWRAHLHRAHRTSSWMWLACWAGLVLVGMVAALVDRNFLSSDAYRPWFTFGVVMWGAILVCASLVVLLFLERRPELLASSAEPGSWDSETTHRSPILRAISKRKWASQIIPPREGQPWSIRNDQTLPLLFASSLAFAFAVRGMVLNPTEIWTYIGATGCLIALLTLGGVLRGSGLLGFVSAGFAATGTLMLIETDPSGWFGGKQPYHGNVLACVLVGLAIVWCILYVAMTVVWKKPMRSRFVWMPNLVMFLASVWLFLAAVVQWVMETGGVGVGVSSLKNGWGLFLFLGTAFLGYCHLWNGSRKGLVGSGCLWFFALTIFATAVLVPTKGLREASVILALGAAVAVLGIFWKRRRFWTSALSRLQAPNLDKLERSMFVEFPVFGVLVGLFVLLAVTMASFNADVRSERYLTALSPFGLAIGFGCWSDLKRRRWVQVLSLGLLTVGAVFVAWADLTPKAIRQDSTRLFVRALLVFAGAMFVYGGLISRWVREGDRWLKSLREMALVTCALAFTCFGIVVFQELMNFVPDVGCGMSLPESVGVTVVVIGMIIGLIVIAVRPKNDPFSLSLGGRMAYVYVAQLMAALLIMHLFFTMPFLFQLGIKDYWPYIAMALCFGGVAVAQLLEKRDLTVLGQPLFHTAAILPIAVAVCIWGVDSKADVALVTLMVGLAYLMISYLHNSIASGVAAIVFGNLALWLFYGKFDGFSFFAHPQLWLIPPALSTLVAAQISRRSFTRSQLALIRYVCVTVIYLGSTSEIFINGIGEQLWPPMILAVLAVGGIMAGIMLQVRAYLYLGAVFLLMAMVSMVSHAHQRLEHVWPWWAFGIGMGVSILVMFGLFEKRKNDLKQVVGKLSQWEL